MHHVLSVCMTCDRYTAPTPGDATPGAQLADALAARMESEGLQDWLALRRVACLSGCKHACNVMLGALGKTKLRLHRITLRQVPAILRLADGFAASPRGEVDDEDWPAGLRDHLAACLPPGGG